MDVKLKWKEGGPLLYPYFQFLLIGLQVYWKDGQLIFDGIVLRLGDVENFKDPGAILMI